MKTALILLIATFAIAEFSGCGGYRLPVGPPGTIFEQRNRATIHDPFPEPDVGPDVVGGRPRGFEQPLPEAERNPLYRDIYGKN